MVNSSSTYVLIRSFLRNFLRFLGNGYQILLYRGYVVLNGFVFGGHFFVEDHHVYRLFFIWFLRSKVNYSLTLRRYTNCVFL